MYIYICNIDPRSCGLLLKKARETVESPDLLDFDDHPYVDEPSASTETPKAYKRWNETDRLVVSVFQFYYILYVYHILGSLKAGWPYK